MPTKSARVPASRRTGYRLTGTEIVSSTDALVMAVFDLDPNAQKIFTLMLAKIGATQAMGNEVVLSLDEIMDCLDLSMTKSLTFKLKQQALMLKAKTVGLPFEDAEGGFRYRSLLSEVRYSPSAKQFCLEIDPVVAPLLLPIAQQIPQRTRFFLHEYLKLRSKYALRLMVLLMFHIQDGTVRYSVGEFKRVFSLAYELPYDVIRRVIDPSVEEVNMKTSLKVQFEVERSDDGSRAITGFIFRLHIEPALLAMLHPETVVSLPCSPRERQVDALPCRDEDLVPMLLREAFGEDSNWQAKLMDALGRQGHASVNQHAEYFRAQLSYSRQRVAAINPQHTSLDLAKYLLTSIAGNYARYTPQASLPIEGDFVGAGTPMRKGGRSRTTLQAKRLAEFQRWVSGVGGEDGELALELVLRFAIAHGGEFPEQGLPATLADCVAPEVYRPLVAPWCQDEAAWESFQQIATAEGVLIAQRQRVSPQPSSVAA